jgi:hypothetical protein
MGLQVYILSTSSWGVCFFSYYFCYEWTLALLDFKEEICQNYEEGCFPLENRKQVTRCSRVSRPPGIALVLVLILIKSNIKVILWYIVSLYSPVWHETCYVAQTHLKNIIFLSQPLSCCHHIHATPHVLLKVILFHIKYMAPIRHIYTH